jgi:coenzyme F420 hydrogenase subunit beta
MRGVNLLIETDVTKTFKDLIKEIHEPGLCGSCGGCVSFCSAGELSAIGFGEDGKPMYINENNCLECGICYLICPQIDALDEEIKNKFSILGCLLDKKLIDGAVVSKKTTQFSREPMIATTCEEILSAAGSRFTGISGVEELSRFSTYSPTMFAIKEVANMDLIKIAVVGTPCQVHTLRKMQNLNVVPSHVVKFILGLFCSENFSFDASEKEDVEKVIGASLDDIEKLNIREDFIIELKNGEKKHIPLEKMENFVRSACLACSDFANDFADLSFGGLGSPEGWTTVLIRTNIGEAIYQEAIHHGYIEELDPSNEEFNEYSTSTIESKLMQFAKMKLERGFKTKRRIRNGN